jgi:hypothetical protein
MRLAFIACSMLVVLSACGGDDKDPHAAATCMGWVDNLGNPFTGTCEAACAKPPDTNGDSCDTTKKLGCAKFYFGDTDGCCIEDSGTIKFYECQ